jgi:hypothetical protein
MVMLVVMAFKKGSLGRVIEGYACIGEVLW